MVQKGLTLHDDSYKNANIQSSRVLYSSCYRCRPNKFCFNFKVRGTSYFDKSAHHLFLLIQLFSVWQVVIPVFLKLIEFEQKMKFLTEPEKVFYLENGFVLLKDVFSRDEVEEMSGEYNNIFQVILALRQSA
jgi:hypothetical protein